MPTLQTRNDLTTNHMKNTKERWNSRHLILDLFVLHCWSGQWRSKIGSFARDRQWDLGNAPPSKSGFAQSSRRRKWRRSANNAVELTLFPATVGGGREEGRKWPNSLLTFALFVNDNAGPVCELYRNLIRPTRVVGPLCGPRRPGLHHIAQNTLRPVPGWFAVFHPDPSPGIGCGRGPSAPASV